LLEHGGQLRRIAQGSRRPLSGWIDLSTGINPNGWPVGPIPDECWQRLPEQEDGLMEAAMAYYGNASILPVAGSQAAIQLLPKLRSHSRVSVLSPAYAEHAENWRQAGHQIQCVASDQIEAVLSDTDVLIIINPNNPTGECFSRKTLLKWHQALAARGGWLIVDEAFIDCQPEQSLAIERVREGLIILRSVGKFFGLAGIRCGFVIAPPVLLATLQNHLGPWSINAPARYVARQALLDSDWQQITRKQLPQQSRRLQQLLAQYGLAPTGGSCLFQWIKTTQAKMIYQHFLQQGILLRLFICPIPSIRLGLPANEAQWQALETVLSTLMHNQKQ
jgi:cobalamin biosynthetic protein CobC